MIYIELNETTFIDAFYQAGRGRQFSRPALEALFAILDDFNGIDIELDVIGICCDFIELSPDEIISEQDLPCTSTNDDVQEYLDANSAIVQYIPASDTFLFMAF